VAEERRWDASGNEQQHRPLSFVAARPYDVLVIDPRPLEARVPAWRRRRLPRLALLLAVLIVPAAVAASYSWLTRSGRAGPTGPVRLERTITVSSWGDWLGPLVFSRNGQTLAALGMENAYLYNPVTDARKSVWTNHDPLHDNPTDLALSPDGKTLIIANDGERSMFLWNIATQKVTATFPDPRNATIYDTALSPDGKLMAESADWAGHTYLWNMVTQRYTAVLSNPDFGVDPLAFSPDGTTLAVGNGAVGDGRRFGQIALWNVARRKIRASYQTPDRVEVQSVAFSPNGTLLAATGIRTAYLWDVTTRHLTATLTGPRGAVIRDIAFSPDGRMLAAIFTSNAACIWSLTTGKIVATMPDPANTEIASLAYSPDGKTLAVGDYDSHIYLWNVSQTDEPRG
jgi:WD40 repeat protein